MYWDGKNVLKKRLGNGDEDVNDTLVGDSGNEQANRRRLERGWQ